VQHRPRESHRVGRYPDRTMSLGKSQRRWFASVRGSSCLTGCAPSQRRQVLDWSSALGNRPWDHRIAFFGKAA
jgi:hypothetical protein